MSNDIAQRLFDRIKHGDAEHRAWLQRELHWFFTQEAAAGQVVAQPADADELQRLRQQVERLTGERDEAVEASEVADQFRWDSEQQYKAEAARLEWFFGAIDKAPYLNGYMTGVREGWSVGQWRAWIDSARSNSGNTPATP